MEIKTTHNMTNNRYGSLRRHSSSDSERWALYQSDYLPQYHYRENPNASIWFIILVFTSFLLGAGIATAVLLMNAEGKNLHFSSDQLYITIIELK